MKNLTRLLLVRLRLVAFDPEFYLGVNEDVADAGTDPLAHYLRFGWREGRLPSPVLDFDRYPAAWREVRGRSGRSLETFAGALRAEVLRAVSAQRLRARDRARLPVAPAAAQWRELIAEQREKSDGASVRFDVVIPVYGARPLALNCIYRVLKARNTCAYELTVIDDAGPDPELRRELDALAADGLFTLVRNDRNLGFVRSANVGFGLHTDRDVVLLNSDTEVYGDWLDRLSQHARQDHRIATVTPFSNNATICSYPGFCRNNNEKLELGYEEIDALCMRLPAGDPIDLPTAIGFSMYVKRACLDDVGMFDAGTFGRGYGEENDFCMRARAKGWRHVLGHRVFVRHIGEASFLDASKRSSAVAQKILDRKHPHYRGLIGEFIRTDPVAPLRRRLDLARARESIGAFSVLHVTHKRGGGTERHVHDMCRLAREEGIGSLILEPDKASGMAELSVPAVPLLPNLPAVDVGRLSDETKALFSDLKLGHIHVHHLDGYPEEMKQWVLDLARALDISFDFSVHDYTSACPRHNLIDGTGVYCGSPPLDVCERCIAANGSEVGKVSVRDWRAAYARFLSEARNVYAPSTDAKQRIETFFPALEVQVREHPEVIELGGAAPGEARGEAQPLRVAVIGAIGAHKGSGVLLRCARDARARKLDIRFVVVGYTNIDKQMRKYRNVEITGRYLESEIGEILEEQACDLAFLPSVWPETYCYTLSLALAAGLHPVAFDIGALGERIRAAGVGTLLPVELMTRPAEINDRLLNVQIDWSGANMPAGRRYPSVVKDYYGLSLDK